MKTGPIAILISIFVFVEPLCRADNQQINEQNLQEQLVQALTNHYEADVSHVQAGNVASSCFSPEKNYILTTRANLAFALTNEFAANSALGWSTNSGILINDASNVAAYYQYLDFNKSNVQQQIYCALTNNFTLDMCTNASTDVAMDCFFDGSVSITNQQSLYKMLTNEFADENGLDWYMNQTALSNDAGRAVLPFFTLTVPLTTWHVDRNQLAQAIGNALTYYFVSEDTALDAEYPLADQCTGATNQSDLFQRVDSALTENAELNLTESTRTAVSSRVVRTLYPPIRPFETLTMLDTNAAQRWLISFSAGAQFLNPYSIQIPGTFPNYGTLTNSGSSTVAYLQIELARHWVLAPTFYTNTLSTGFVWNHWFRQDWTHDWSPDFDFNLGFLLGNNYNSSNYSAQTLAGSDIYMNAGTAIPIYRNSWQPSDPVPFQASFAAAVELGTDQRFERIHPKVFFGPQLDFGLPYGLFHNTNAFNQGLIELRGGAGWLDVPFTTGISNEVNLSSDGIPEFKEKWVPEVGAHVLIPFGSQLYLDFESNAYFTSHPDQWDIKVGVTIPFSTIGKQLSFLGLGPGS